MISHNEAEILTSARQDSPLDPVVERELQAHLATCDDCRAFAAATERLTAGIKALPSVPVNPRMRREVMEKVQGGRNPLAGVFSGFNGRFQPGPVFAAAAAVLLIGLFGWLALDRLVLDGGGSDSNQIAAVPTEAPLERFAASPTQEPPTEVSTLEPTSEPTSVPTEEPTAEPTSEPTAEPTIEPTVKPALEPTAQTTDGDPVDLTSSSQETAETLSLESEEPTAQPTREPTSVPTVAPTREPTAEPTSVPTIAPTQEPTTEPEPTETPPIELIGDPGSTEVPTGIGSGPGQPTPPIESTANNDAGDASSSAIEQMNGESEDPGASGDESTPEGDEALESDGPAGQTLAEVSVRYSGIAGDPSGQLGLTRDGRLEFMQVPDSASMWTNGGYRLQVADQQPGVIYLCADGVCEPSMEAPESDTWQGDVPLGVIGESGYFMRLHSDRAEVYAFTSEGPQVVEANVIAELGPTSAPAAVYENNGIMFTWLPTGEWLEISGGSAQLFSGSFANPYNVRFAPVASDGPLLGYFSNGTLVIAPVTSPDSPILSIPTDGIDFDIAPQGDRVAVIRGSDIVIYDLQGNVLSSYEGGDLQPGSLIWLRGGIVYVDRATGALYEISAPVP